jgi:thiol-disulfide isomerase/thioredoxin
MKIVLVLIAVLLLSSGAYLYSVQPSVVPQTQLASDSEPTPEIVDDAMCTSTACMRKTEQSATNTAIAPVNARYTEFVNPSGFINAKPFSMADYIGKKIILVEFITYSCINCQRTFPFMKQWHETYAKDGLLVIGIHTPEFAYERDRDNVIAAMKKEGITFPIVQDNKYETWNAYNNRFWPHRYIIDYDGSVVFDHIGEGAYAETEAVIKQLLETNPNES